MVIVLIKVMHIQTFKEQKQSDFFRKLKNYAKLYTLPLIVHYPYNYVIILNKNHNKLQVGVHEKKNTKKVV